MSLNIQRDEELDEAGALLYAISTADIIPDFILIPTRTGLFGQFLKKDPYIPDFYESLGYDSRNFIVCTGSILIFLTIQIILLSGGELSGLFCK